MRPLLRGNVPLCRVRCRIGWEWRYATPADALHAGRKRQGRAVRQACRRQGLPGRPKPEVPRPAGGSAEKRLGSGAKVNSAVQHSARLLDGATIPKNSTWFLDRCRRRAYLAVAAVVAWVAA